MSDSRFRQNQVWTFARAGAAIVLAGLLLTGCGKRPATVDAPDSVMEDHFPLVYPDTATDPQPDKASK